MIRESPQVKPLPQQGAQAQAQVMPPPYDDAPLVDQPVPEQPAFVDAWSRVGRPRMVVMAMQTADDTSDHTAIEDELADWLGCNGQVTLIAPAMARQRLGQEQIKDSRAAAQLAQQVDADVVIQVQAHPAGEQHAGTTRLLADAYNTEAGSRSGARLSMCPRQWISRRSTATRGFWRAS